MYDQALQIIGVVTTFCAVVTALFCLLGLTMDYAWRKMRDAAGLYRLYRCYRLVSRVMKNKKGQGEQE